ncbi:DNA replication licensing factor MCM6 [Capsicum baccatum]|uniref:DNA replication licensing factor MCM6 n=1 Tax=Capsicum baccatum TaxID=33114 RepID=A0A2G2XP37_CAPBA|nr:DNA replication licensing factor MCM6 [Capsicum baccatum]
MDDNTKGEDAAAPTPDIKDATSSMVQPEKVEKRKQEEKKTMDRTLPYPPPPFPQRLRKVADDTKFSKFMTMLKQLTINVPLVEVLEQMPGYVKFMKDLLTKKRAASYELKEDVHHWTGLAGMRQKDLIQWYISKQNDKNIYSSMEGAVAEVAKVKAIIESLIRREGHLIVVDDGRQAGEDGGRQPSRNNRILAVAPNYVVD